MKFFKEASNQPLEKAQEMARQMLYEEAYNEVLGVLACMETSEIGHKYYEGSDKKLEFNLKNLCDYLVNHYQLCGDLDAKYEPVIWKLCTEAISNIQYPTLYLIWFVLVSNCNNSLYENVKPYETIRIRHLLSEFLFGKVCEILKGMADDDYDFGVNDIEDSMDEAVIIDENKEKTLSA